MLRMQANRQGRTNRRGERSERRVREAPGLAPHMYRIAERKKASACGSVNAALVHVTPGEGISTRFHGAAGPWQGSISYHAHYKVKSRKDYKTNTNTH